MKIPKRLESLFDEGLVDEVVRQLMSGKEATVYMVRSRGEIRCAKVYKEAHQRSFRQSVLYQEGRKVRGSRQARAMGKRTKFGRKEQESVWQSAEVAALYKLADAGVRVPKPYGLFDGVLIMEMVADEYGDAAPRLNDLAFEPEDAVVYHDFLINQIVRMLCAGLVHGDLSEFNVLVGEEGPVIIDLPQAVDAAANHNARMMLERDVANMTAYFAQFAPELHGTQYGKEIWGLFDRGELHPALVLTGRVAEETASADVDGLMQEIEAVRQEYLERMQYE